MQKENKCITFQKIFTGGQLLQAMSQVLAIRWWTKKKIDISSNVICSLEEERKVNR